MIPSLLRYIIRSVLALLPFQVAAGDILYLTEHHYIDVQSEQHYTTAHFIEGLQNDVKEQAVAFQVSQTEKVDDLTVTVFINDEPRKFDLKSKLSISTMDWSAFFTGSQTYSIKLPPLSRFTISYTTTNDNTVYLSKIYRNGYFSAREYTCRVNLPDNLVLATNQGKTYSGSNIVFDSTQFEGKAIYCLVHQRGVAPNAYFSEWFAQRIDPLIVLKPELLPAALEELNRQNDRQALARACFRYVQQEIKYVDIENGVNAIIPRPAPQTLSNKLGDCKDMSTLLHALLKHYGFETYLAISKTFEKKDTFDFPSLSMANHMIVVLQLNGNTFFLDATEDECLFGDPSFQILGTEAFLLRHPESYFIDVPATLHHTAAMDCQYSFAQNEQQQTVMTIRLHTSGKLNTRFLALPQEPRSQNAQVASDLFYLFPFKFTVESITTGDTSGTIVLTAVIPASKITQIGAKRYLDPAFLPAPEQFSRFFSGGHAPTYTAVYTMQFSGLTVPATTGTTHTIRSLATNTGTKLELTVDKETLQKDGELAAFWKTFTAKPFILTVP